MPNSAADKKYRCKLLPHTRTDVLSVQDARQKAGWEITAFELPRAWRHTRGANVKVAVLDTGADYKHPDLSDNILYGHNFVAGDKDFMDRRSGHGTHVCGIIAAQDNDIGVVGVAPKAKLIVGKVLDDGGNGDLRHVAAGVRWAADEGADIITMSLGSPAPVAVIRKAIQYAASKGVVTFCAAGNAGKTKEIFYPANYPETISIGAIDKDFNRAKFSCTGNLSFVAPGVEILSTVPKGWYALMSGTSMANPFAVGVAALLLSYRRERGLPEFKTADEWVEELRKYTSPAKKIGGQRFYEGFGIIDPRKIVF